MSKTDVQKLHAQKTTILQQYRPTYTNHYNITVDENLGNFARVCFDNGKELILDGAERALGFLKMASVELKEAVGKIVSPMITEEQDKLFTQLGLNEYRRMNPIQEQNLPYFILTKNEYASLAYSPIAQQDRFAILIHNDFGQAFMGSDHRMFGIYADQLKELPFEDAALDKSKIFEVLERIEPAAVREYQEQTVIQKLEQLRQETGARPYAFFGDPETAPVINLPAEAEDLLTPEEKQIAEDLIVAHQWPDQSPNEEEAQSNELSEDDQDLDNDEDMGMGISM